MPTPTYQGQGQGQPVADNGGGWLARLSSYFGGASAPVYASAPIVTPTVTPDPKSGDATTAIARPVTTCAIDPAVLAAGQIVLIVPREMDDGRIAIDPDALAGGQIAIVVPRNALTP